MQNSGRTTFKRTSIDRLMNVLVLMVSLITFVQMCLSFSHAPRFFWSAPSSFWFLGVFGDICIAFGNWDCWSTWCQLLLYHTGVNNETWLVNTKKVVFSGAAESESTDLTMQVLYTHNKTVLSWDLSLSVFSTNGKQYQAMILLQTLSILYHLLSKHIREGPPLSPPSFGALHSDVAALSIAGRKAVFLWMQDWLLALWSSVLNIYMCIFAHIKQCHSTESCSGIIFKPLGPLFSEH